MSIDDTVKRLDREFSQQAALLAIGDAWMEQTEGLVVRGDGSDVVITRDQYIEQLQEIPLGDEIKKDVETYVPLMRKKFFKGEYGEREKNVLLLKFFPRVLYVVQHFLADPDYTRNSKPIDFLNILTRYYPFSKSPDKFSCRSNICAGIDRHISLGRLTIDEVQQKLGMTENWQAYTKTNGVPKKYEDLLRTCIQHFLNNPDYSDCYPEGESFEDRKFMKKEIFLKFKRYCISHWKQPFGEPFKLSVVLRCYHPHLMNGYGGYYSDYSDWSENNNLANALDDGILTERQVLEAADVVEEWEAYQQTRGIPRYVREDAHSSIEHFLGRRYVHIVGEGIRRVSRNRKFRKSEIKPIPLMKVLRSYSIGFSARDEGFSGRQRGEWRIFSLINKGCLHETQLLDAIGMRAEWENYQETTGYRPNK